MRAAGADEAVRAQVDALPAQSFACWPSHDGIRARRPTTAAASRRYPDGAMQARSYRRPMTGRSVRVGRLAGIPIGIQPLWLAIVGLITWSLGHDYFPAEVDGIASGQAYALGLVAALLLFVSILLHELGHAVVARRRGVEIEEIDLWLLGGVARMKQEPKRGRDELAFAAAGPAVTAVIAGVLAVIGVALPSHVDALRALVDYELYVNAAVLGFNLLPAFPLDGGRILRALLWIRSGDHDRATARAAGIGRAFGIGMIVLGVLSVLGGAIAGLWFALIGMFLLAAGGAESQHAALHARFGDEPIRELLASPVISVPGDLTAAEAIPAYFVRYLHTAYPVIDDAGRVTGLLTIDAVRGLAHQQRAATDVASLSDQDPQLIVHPHDSIADVLTRPAFLRSGHAIAVDDNGHAVGMLAAVDVQRWVQATDLLPRAAVARGV
jgi:Zn-dependent protease